MAQHSHYWSCSKFANWIRGTPKLKSGTSREWNKWNYKAKSTHPIRFWLAEDGLDKIQDFITYPTRKLYDLKYYINNRYVTRTHALTAHRNDISPGNWSDVGSRFLPCLFNELVDFVEIEQAWSHIAWSDKTDRLKYNAPFWATGWFRWRTWRCPQAGLDHLAWASLLNCNEYVAEDHKDRDKPTGQAIAAMEILALYNWWKARPSRPNLYDLSGWTALYKDKYDLFSEDTNTPEEKKEAITVLDKLHELELAYSTEDEDMLIRLIKIRERLWT